MATRKKTAPYRPDAWWHSTSKSTLYKRRQSPRARAVRHTAPPPRRFSLAKPTRRGWVVIGSVLVVLVLLGLLTVPRPSKAVVSLVSPALAPDERALPSSVTTALGAVAVGEMVKASEDKAVHVTPPVEFPTSSTLLSTGKKPEVLYMCNEFDGYCADVSWPLVMALQKFGSFDRLGYVTSAGSFAPGTSGLDFYTAGYSSKYISFVADEMYTTREAKAGQWQVLQAPTTAETAVLEDWDVSPYVTPSHSTPFIDFGGRYLMAGPGYNGQSLQALSADPAKAVLGTSTQLTAGKSASSLGAEALAGHIVGTLCALTKNAPPVCHGLPKALEKLSEPAAFNNEAGAPTKTKA